MTDIIRGASRSVRMEYDVRDIDGENIKAHRYEGGMMCCVQVYDKAGKPVRSSALNRASVLKLFQLYGALLKDWQGV